MRTHRLPVVIAIACVLAAPLGAQAASSDTSPKMSAGGGQLLPLEPVRSSMSAGQGALLGLVEGLTEFLPISSTGHLAVVQELLGLTATPQEKDASNAFAIVIQAGAIIAVFLVMFGRIRKIVSGMFGRDTEGLKLLGNLAVAFVPAALAGLFLEDRIKRHLYGIWPIAAAWLVGGIFILVVLNRRRLKEGTALESLGWQSALIIGLAQVLALWPGVSRSLVTIAGGLFVGLSVSAAVEFSFLLGLVTLGAATIYEAIRQGHLIVQSFGVDRPADRPGGGSDLGVRRGQVDDRVPQHAQPRDLRLVPDRARRPSWWCLHLTAVLGTGDPARSADEPQDPLTEGDVAAAQEHEGRTGKGGRPHLLAEHEDAEQHVQHRRQECEQAALRGRHVLVRPRHGELRDRGHQPEAQEDQPLHSRKAE